MQLFWLWLIEDADDKCFLHNEYKFCTIVDYTYPTLETETAL